MHSKSAVWIASGLGGVLAFGIHSVSAQEHSISGTVDTSYYGTTPAVVQTHVTQYDGNPPYATATNTSSLVQFSNAFGKISSDNQYLYLFIGGSIIDNDTQYGIALQVNGSGTSSLAGHGLQGNVGNINFKAFSPNVFVSIVPGISNGQTGVFYPGATFTDLKNGLKTGSPNLTNSDIPTRGNNALLYTAVGTGEAAQTVNGYNAPADPGYAGVTTGFEMQLPLSSLNYTAGDNIEISAFPIIGSGTRTNDQILSPLPMGLDASTNYDYIYLGGGGSPRQFDNTGDYPESEFFTIAGNPVPEPASIGLIVMGAIPLLRRSRKCTPKTI